MAIIYGTATGRDGVLSGVSVELKNKRFETVYQTFSDETGFFSLSVPDGTYPFLTAVREYGNRYLEYWAQNVPAQGELMLNVRIDMLEVYGLHAFHVKGAANTLMIFFRPMSLEKFKSGDSDIAPDLSENDVTVTVDGLQSNVYSLSRVREYAGEDVGFLTAYLLQASVPRDADEWKRVDITVHNGDGQFGCAALFR